jgi:hypothetical protein
MMSKLYSMPKCLVVECWQAPIAAVAAPLFRSLFLPDASLFFSICTQETAENRSRAFLETKSRWVLFVFFTGDSLLREELRLAGEFGQAVSHMGTQVFWPRGKFLLAFGNVAMRQFREILRFVSGHYHSCRLQNSPSANAERSSNTLRSSPSLILCRSSNFGLRFGFRWGTLWPQASGESSEASCHSTCRCFRGVMCLRWRGRHKYFYVLCVSSSPDHNRAAHAAGSRG